MANDQTRYWIAEVDGRVNVLVTHPHGRVLSYYPRSVLIWKMARLLFLPAPGVVSAELVNREITAYRSKAAREMLLALRREANQ